MYQYKELPALLGLTILALILCPSSIEGGCSSGQTWSSGQKEKPRISGFRVQALCCPGKNSTCLADGGRLNNLRAVNCFCDESCIEIGDCCTDYADACPVRDCVLSDRWGEWSDCSSQCGTGYKIRKRDIIVQPANGGRPCEVNTQKMPCEGTKCKVARDDQGFHLLRERARIVPSQFGSWRQNKLYNPYEDIRRNLFNHYKLGNKIDRPPYCAQYEIVDVHAACQSSSLATDWSVALRPGASLCVECQPFSMKTGLGGRCMGHGVLHKWTGWKAMTVPGCHGKWKMTRDIREGCQCDPNSPSSFVLI